ncbi:MAG: hypothetical protein GW760_01665 [Legionella sp.]|nr:hypothetical protein [Legionella sp.]
MRYSRGTILQRSPVFSPIESMLRHHGGDGESCEMVFEVDSRETQKKSP